MYDGGMSRLYVLQSLYETSRAEFGLSAVRMIRRQTSTTSSSESTSLQHNTSLQNLSSPALKHSKSTTDVLIRYVTKPNLWYEGTVALGGVWLDVAPMIAHLHFLQWEPNFLFGISIRYSLAGEVSWSLKFVWLCCVKLRHPLQILEAVPA